MNTSMPPKPETLEATVDGDLIVVRVRGEYSLAVERYVQALREPVIARYGYRFTLIDATHVSTIPPDARRAMIAWNRQHRGDGAVAIVGASFMVSTLTNMVLIAIRSLMRRELDFRFFDSEAEARAWLEGRRPHYQRPSRDAAS